MFSLVHHPLQQHSQMYNINQNINETALDKNNDVAIFVATLPMYDVNKLYLYWL